MAFQIETLALPNRARLGICPLPGRGGAGMADIAAILRWSPDIVVSMTEMAEMDRHGMADLGSLLADADVGWVHFPIKDFGAPAETSDWAALAADLHAVLDTGGSVLAHCYGGRGRSGMVLLRLMAERGIDPGIARARLREIRPGAVETNAQFAWAAMGRRR